MPRAPKQVLPPLSNSPETIGQRIARYRKLKGLTQVELAQKIGIERTVIANYEKDRLRIYDDMLGHLALALGISADTLLGIKIDTTETPALSLRLVRRLAEIDAFPEIKKKRILQTLDDSIEANKSKQEPSGTNT